MIDPYRKKNVFWSSRLSVIIGSELSVITKRWLGECH